MNQPHHKFYSIAQPIVSKKTLSIYAMEILSRSAHVFDIELFFKKMSAHESMLFTCSQLKLIDKVPKSVKLNINAISESVLDIYFINELEKIDASKIAIEIDYFHPNLKVIDELSKVIHHIKSLGGEVWLDDYRLNEYSNLLLSIPWTGVKVDKETVWSKMDEFNELEKMIQNCKQDGLLVTLEGIENKFIYDLVKNMSADFFQGYYWPSKKYG
ncbi:MAG: EAL domain-containing protein [Turicibacter sp.]